jgi:hypothetical protein
MAEVPGGFRLAVAEMPELPGGFWLAVAEGLIHRQLKKPLFGRPYLKFGQCFSVFVSGFIWFKQVGFSGRSTAPNSMHSCLRFWGGPAQQLVNTNGF